MGGRSDIKNVNMSQGGSLGYISTLSSDINTQTSLCGHVGGGVASEPDRGTQEKANRWEGEVMTTGVAAN